MMNMEKWLAKGADQEPMLIMMEERLALIVQQEPFLEKVLPCALLVLMVHNLDMELLIAFDYLKNNFYKKKLP